MHHGFASKVESYWDRVSTGSGSDPGQTMESRIISESRMLSLTRSLPLPLLTRSNASQNIHCTAGQECQYQQ